MNTIGFMNDNYFLLFFCETLSIIYLFFDQFLFVINKRFVTSTRYFKRVKYTKLLSIFLVVRRRHFSPLVRLTFQGRGAEK